MSQKLTNEVERLKQRMDRMEVAYRQLEDALRRQADHAEATYQHRRGRKANGEEHARTD